MAKTFKALMAGQEYAEAERAARAFLEVTADKQLALTLIAKSLLAQGRPDEALEFTAQAIQASPSSVALVCHATALEAVGRIDEAMAQYRRCVEAFPNEGFAYYALARNRQPIAPPMGLPPAHMAYVEYALGKGAEDAGRCHEAMRHYDQANALLLQTVLPRQPGLVAESLAFRLQNLDKAFVEAGRQFGSPSETPIFIVGMMRSGTTLAEQILTSHPLVGTIGERRFWLDRRSTVLDPPGNRVNPARLQQACHEYLSLMSPGRTIVDRTPINYAHLAIIHVAFPNARIVHMNRHPADTCLSIWATPDSAPREWAHDKAAIVEEYRAYQTIMEHWRSIIPTDRLLDIQYEELVENQDEVTRRMIAFCGLEWDDACLKPEQNARAVSTPSVWQVRQKVYQTSKARWKGFEPWLGEFRELLD